MTTFECYQSTNNGVYILRLGGGLFGDLLGFPQQGATWQGCGANGTVRCLSFWVFLFRLFPSLDECVCFPRIATSSSSRSQTASAWRCR